GWPMRPPVNASPRPSRAPAHDSGPMWIATPSSQGTCTLYSLPVSRRTQMFSGSPQLPDINAPRQHFPAVPTTDIPSVVEFGAVAGRHWYGGRLAFVTCSSSTPSRLGEYWLF